MHTVRFAPTLLRGWLAVAPPELRVDAEYFDPVAVTQGLVARVESADDWVITVRPTRTSDGPGDMDGAEKGGDGTPCPRDVSRVGDAVSRGASDPCADGTSESLGVDVSLRRPDGSLLLRRLRLEAMDIAGRSRELASLLAVLFEGGLVGEEVGPAETTTQPDVPNATPPETDESSPGPRRHPMESAADGPIRWVVIEGRVGYGDARLRGGGVLDGGVGLSSGGRLLRDRLLLRGAVGWATSVRPTLSMSGYRVGAGIGVGGSLWRRRLWLGGEVSPHLLVVQISDVATTTLTSSSVEVVGHAQLGVGRFTAQLRTGVDLVLPPIVGIGRDDEISWGGPRFIATLGVGARF